MELENRRYYMLRNQTVRKLRSKSETYIQSKLMGFAGGDFWQVS